MAGRCTRSTAWENSTMDGQGQPFHNVVRPLGAVSGGGDGTDSGVSPKIWGLGLSPGDFVEGGRWCGSRMPSDRVLGVGRTSGGQLESAKAVQPNPIGDAILRQCEHLTGRDSSCGNIRPAIPLPPSSSRSYTVSCVRVNLGSKARSCPDRSGVIRS
jgi:hypothetical protein